jgi:hypothetical protein
MPPPHNTVLEPTPIAPSVPLSLACFCPGVAKL